ncbi:bifunctional indole-3-glycerol phosphate synthase/phosphoribosylanthranilate isomerase [Helicobacter sp. 11S02596-1]|uniref:bifunctional indole-3-glycerol phosphate synthase/phosphoribosylanthranilate isomerase n=1 Tax=Helicobacter sp. 11S02596-1 TaxID=1476194 RepID=UPI000BA69DBE|nr:bifunctional indole-3-glycerol phosphate synthase/phosphoribosylanthranilate isomerase [Helicobacter sp. 11S02596-1]PAF45034.1 hypothetical protein BJI48_00220 [Helicobacter sp. 11S02596-1]
MAEVLEKIAQNREEKIQKLGFHFGFSIPKERKAPLCPPRFDPNAPLMIAEIKRSSPSAGHIGEIKDPIALARNYLNNGANVISVLTEQDYFGGSLADLMAVKNAFKNASVLRKDFIQSPEEIAISYLAGADLVLLIVAMFIGDSKKEAIFQNILLECQKYALTPLLEIHNEEECQFALRFVNPANPSASPILGINSRNLRTFVIDKPKALHLRTKIPAPIKTIFESGIQSSFDGYLAGSFGFDGMLCGSYLVASKETGKNLQHLIKSFTLGKKHQNPFYPSVFASIYSNPTPLVKICGITDIDDAYTASEAGADMIGFILTPKSPRYISAKDVKLMSKAMNKLYPNVLKIGVITENKEELIIAKELFKEGFLDAIQLHAINPDTPDIYAGFDLKEADFNFYACSNFENLCDYPKEGVSPFVLLDSKSPQTGGSGKSIATSELKKLKNLGKKLFIAGGIGLDNIDEILCLQPKMLDINSKIEQTPGKKDKIKLKEIIHKIKTSHQLGSKETR